MLVLIGARCTKFSHSFVKSYSNSTINLQEITEENVGEVNQDLREIINEAGVEDQTVENLQVVTSVFTTTAALLSEPTIPVEEDVSEQAFDY